MARQSRQARCSSRLCLIFILAAVALAAVPATVIAGLPNAVIGAGKVNAIKALQGTHRYTLYFYTRDKKGRSTCYGRCLTRWSPVLTGSKAFAHKGSGVAQKLLGTTHRRDGKLQVTYNHLPLYTYKGDYRPGDDGGQGCSDHSGHSWWMVAPDGKAIKNIIGCQGY